MDKNQYRRVPKTFSLRLDILEKLEEKAPLGERSAFLEQMLIRELERPSQTD